MDTAPTAVCKMPLKVRPAKSRAASSSSAVQNAPVLGGMVPQQLTVYQPLTASSQVHQYLV